VRTRAIAPIAGARVSHKAIVTTIEVRYPNGRIPRSTLVPPANSISSHALRKKAGPAVRILK
jgi:hypothetical protein